MNNCPTCGAPCPNEEWDWGKIADLNPHGCTNPEVFNVKETYLLFAAAPELLTACRMLVALEDGDVHDADTSWKQARKIMRAAIAKAEGRGE